MNIRKNIDFNSNIDKLELEIDVFHFENAISNLIDNAIKYGGDEISITTKDVVDRKITISVNDNGSGISNEDESYIFNTFFRVKNNNIHTIKGYGIGLHYTKNIIEKHDGKIELRNRNTFLITLCTK